MNKFTNSEYIYELIIKIEIILKNLQLNPAFDNLQIESDDIITSLKYIFKYSYPSMMNYEWSYTITQHECHFKFLCQKIISLFNYEDPKYESINNHFKNEIITLLRSHQLLILRHPQHFTNYTMLDKIKANIILLFKILVDILFEMFLIKYNITHLRKKYKKSLKEISKKI